MDRAVWKKASYQAELQIFELEGENYDEDNAEFSEIFAVTNDFNKITIFLTLEPFHLWAYFTRILVILRLFLFVYKLFSITQFKKGRIK